MTTATYDGQWCVHALRNPSKTYAGYPKAEAKKKITLMKVIFRHFYQKAGGGGRRNVKSTRRAAFRDFCEHN